MQVHMQIQIEKLSRCRKSIPILARFETNKIKG